MSQMEKSRNGILIKAICLTLIVYSLFQLIDAARPLITFSNDKGFPREHFGYPVTLDWLILIFVFWFFSLLSWILGFFLIRIGWVLLNSFLVILITVVGINLFSGLNKLELWESFKFIILLLLFVTFCLGKVRDTFGVNRSVILYYSVSIVVAVGWFGFFLLVDKH
jgi:hypothetical protein